MVSVGMYMILCCKRLQFLLCFHDIFDYVDVRRYLDSKGLWTMIKRKTRSGEIKEWREYRCQKKIKGTRKGVGYIK